MAGPWLSLETERMVLRPIAESDSDFQFILMNTPKWLAHIGDRNIRTEDDAARYIRERLIAQFERLGYGTYCCVRKSDGARLGNCGLYDREGLEGVDIGFAFLPEYEGMGYGTEAALRLRDAAFTEFGLSEISAITIVENLASQRLLEKIGLRFTRYVTLPGDSTKLLYYWLGRPEHT